MKKIFAFFILSLLLTSAIAQTTFIVDGINYATTSGTTVEVTYGETFYTGNITIPSTVLYLGVTYAVTSIGNQAFSYGAGLTSIIIPSSVLSIWSNQFKGCTNLAVISVESANTNYSSQDGVLFNKEKTTLICCPRGKVGSYSIPSSVISIDGEAFSYCTGLASITFPSSVTSIYAYSFSYCAGLTSFIVDAANANYCTQDGVLFNKDKSTLVCYPAAKTGSYTIPSTVTTIGGNAFYNCTGLTSITIPNTVTSIQVNAIRGCTGLTSITIPSSVTSMDSNNFMECYSLTAINVETANTNYSSQDGVLFNKEKTILIRYPHGRVGSYSIPSSVTSVMSFSFMYSIIKSITIPSSITAIGSCVFSDCKNLTSISIPSSVTSIGSQAFAACDNLDSIAVYSTLPPTLDAYAFYQVSSTVKFYVPDSSLLTYKNANVWKNFTNLLGLSQLVFPTLEVPAYIPTNGLVGWWPFNGNANDESGNNLNGIVTGATLAIDRFGRGNSAYYFNGSDNYITVENQDAFNQLSSQISIAAWINTYGTTNDHQIVIGKWYKDGTPNTSWLFELQPNGNIIQMPISGVSTDNYSNASSNEVLNYNQWYFVVGVYDSQSVKIYINGILRCDLRTSGEISVNESNVIIGAHDSQVDRNPFFGMIDDIGIWNRALTQQEITTLYNATDPRISTDSLNIVSGKTFTFPINTSSLVSTDSIDSYQFVLTYDTTKLEYSDFTTSNTLSSSGTALINTTEKGKLKVGFIDNGYMNGSGELLKLYFKAINAGETTPAISDFLYNTDTIKNISNGTISIFTRYGDADGNDYVQAHDAALVLKYSVGLDPIPSIDPIPWSGWRVEASDVDGNDTLTANDAGLILQRSIDLISSFPVEGLNAVLRSASAIVPDVTITKEGNNLVFKSYGDLIGLNVALKDKYSALGTPLVLDNNFMRATNINESTYKIGLATATSPADGSTFMTIPIIDPTASEITIMMYVNTTEKIIRANIATGVMSVSDNMINVYPNPIKDNLTIDFGSMTNCSLRITNILGQTVYSSQVHSQKMDINMSKIASSGLYYLQVIDNQKNVIAIKKLLKK